MATQEYIKSLCLGDNIFEFITDTEIRYLIHFAAPLTGGGKILIHVGIKFAPYGPMRDDALYIGLVEDNDNLLHQMLQQEKDNHPGLANRIQGFSFFITEEEIKKSNLKFVNGSKERVLEIIKLIRDSNLRGKKICV